MCLEAGVSALVLVPLFLVLNWRHVHNLGRTIGYIVFAVYLSAVDSVVGLPSILYVRFHLNVNLRPFAYMFSDFTSLLNVALFLPLGVFLPLFCKHFRKLYRTLLFGFGTSLLIEVLQIFTFRATDVNDLMTNTLGTLLGWCIGRVVLWICPDTVPQWERREIYLVCGITFGVMFFVQPFLAETAWFLLR